MISIIYTSSSLRQLRAVRVGSRNGVSICDWADIWIGLERNIASTAPQRLERMQQQQQQQQQREHLVILSSSLTYLRNGDDVRLSISKAAGSSCSLQAGDSKRHAFSWSRERWPADAKIKKLFKETTLLIKYALGASSKD